MTNVHNQNFYAGVAGYYGRVLRLVLIVILKFFEMTRSHRVEWFVGRETERTSSFIKKDFLDLSWVQVSYLHFHEFKYLLLSLPPLVFAK
jgi:hypothetical protein